VRKAGFDHVTQGAISVAAGASRALGLTREQAANAIAIAATAFNALRVTRTGRLSHWKGLAFPNAAACALRAVFLARNGITGPPEAFEGHKGFMERISGRFDADWEHEDLERVNRTILKRYNAEIHSQTCVDAMLELRRREGLDAARVDRVEVEVFDVAFHIIGGGEEGSKKTVTTREEADHSLPYILAVALLDGQVMPAQYAPARLARADVQDVLRRVFVRSDPALSARFPAEMPCRLRVSLKDGRTVSTDASDYPGFVTRPMTWEEARAKFELLSENAAAGPHRSSIARTVADLDLVPVAELTALLAGVRVPPAKET